MKDIKWMGMGMLLGLSFFMAVLLVKPVGVSTQFSVISGMVHNAIGSNVITENPNRESGYESTNAYYDRSEGKLAKSIKHPLNYGFIFFLAIPFGGLLGSLFVNKNTHTTKEKLASIVPNQSFMKQYLPSFISGFLLLYGARMAGGCTSGHMMSGIMQSSVSGFIFAASVFAVAVPAAIITSKNPRKGVRS